MISCTDSAFRSSARSAAGSAPSRTFASMVLAVSRLVSLGFEVLATEGTVAVLRRNGIPAQPVRKLSEGPGPNGEPTIVDLIMSGEIDMVINTPSGQDARADGYAIRAAVTAVDRTLITTIALLGAAVQAIEAQQRSSVTVRSLQEHDADRAQRQEAAVAAEVGA